MPLLYEFDIIFDYYFFCTVLKELIVFPSMIGTILSIVLGSDQQVLAVSYTQLSSAQIKTIFKDKTILNEITVIWDK